MQYLSNSDFAFKFCNQTHQRQLTLSLDPKFSGRLLPPKPATKTKRAVVCWRVAFRFLQNSYMGLWAIKTLAAKVSDAAKQWLVKQTLWQLFPSAPKTKTHSQTKISCFHVKCRSPNLDIDVLFCPTVLHHGGLCGSRNSIFTTFWTKQRKTFSQCECSLSLPARRTGRWSSPCH